MTDKAAAYTSPPSEIRVLRIIIAVALVGSMIYALRHLFNVKIIEENKLEFGMILGWLVSKAGTVVDWLFGGSESGGRRADLASHQAAMAPPMGSTPPTNVVEAAKVTADAAADKADEIAGDSQP
jgi:hypothetical protein